MADSYNDLSDSQMALLEGQLREQQEGLRAEVQEERAKSDDERDRRSAREVQDRGDEANTDQWREANAAMIDHHVDEISGIQAALSRVQSGTYGLCVDCGEAIGFQRLQAYPSANRCVQCQSKAESA
ncbi:MAG: TraR/DksA family transcriptional regulator [Gammaproteobacteria bacterium]|nr:TraR/DksA family transcriptional regulator [Gammaproteobacteria bacterium]NCF81244.1 TraR/DksA family transcriptional regulator [Pseudomonadota bacterium]